MVGKLSVVNGYYKIIQFITVMNEISLTYKNRISVIKQFPQKWGMHIITVELTLL